VREHAEADGGDGVVPERLGELAELDALVERRVGRESGGASSPMGIFTVSG